MFPKALTWDDISIVPGYSDIMSREECDTSIVLDKKRRIILNTPIIASPMDTVCEKEMAIAIGKLGGLGIIHRFMSIEEQVEQCNSVSAVAVHVGAAIGVGEKSKERTRALVAAGVGILDIDIAHGDSKYTIDAVNWLRGELKFDGHIMVGTVAVGDAIRRLDNYCDFDSIRVGLGGGAGCETRIRSGIGIPGESSVLDCAGRNRRGKTIIADGGLRTPGDICKAIALGANAVMLGNLLAGTRESPGSIHKRGEWPNQVLYKKYMGSASLESKLRRGEEGKNVEGASYDIVYKGKTKRIVNDIMDGLRSSMSYVGARTIEEFQRNADFVRVTNAGVIEATPHGRKKGL